jgi:hypothetical protein
VEGEAGVAVVVVEEPGEALAADLEAQLVLAGGGGLGEGLDEGDDAVPAAGELGVGRGHG